jgi:hypothetical protein
MPGKKRKAAGPAKKVSTLERVKAKKIMEDLHTTLRKHGVAGKIDSMAFTDAPPCRCPDGRPGVLRVVGGRLICVCDT